MDNGFTLVIILCCILGFTLAIMEAQNRRQQLEREQWAAERKDLMDRIQAPTFQEYTNKVVREKKAEQPPVEREQAVEFVS